LKGIFTKKKLNIKIKDLQLIRYPTVMSMNKVVSELTIAKADSQKNCSISRARIVNKIKYNKI
jgi:hypothetical protein